MAKQAKRVLFHRPPWFPSWGAVWRWLKHYFGGLYDRIDQHHVFLHAGGIAFSLFVCVVPMVLILFFVLGTVLEREQVQRELSVWIDRVVPYEKYTEEPKLFIFSRLDEFAEWRNIAGVVGAIGLLLAASGLFSSMRTVLNVIFHTSSSKHVLIGKLRDLGMVLMVIGFFLLSVLTLPILNLVIHEAQQLGGLTEAEFGRVQQVGVAVAAFLIMYLAFWSLYYFVPYAKMERRVVLVSAFWAALLWEAAKQAFTVYLSNATALPVIYGTYVFFIVAAFWIYYSAVVFMLGAEIGQLYRERRAAKLAAQWAEPTQ